MSVSPNLRKWQKRYTQPLPVSLKKDWVGVCDEDKELNNEDFKNRDWHVLAQYETPEGDIYINLTFDELEPGSNTATLMFCEEY